MKKLLLASVAALSLLNAAGAHAEEPLKWQCGNVGVTVTYKPADDDRWFSGDTEYTLTGAEKANNRFKWTSDGLYLNGKICWPVTPITCLRPDGTSESCESRQVPLPKPRPADAPEAVPIPKTVLYYEPGGYLHILEERWRKLAESGDDVEIRGPCFSGCTMIMAHVPKERICFERVASLNFHLPQVDDREVALQGGRYMLNRYPQDIRLWLREKGGVENMPHREGWWILWAHELWDMGYRKCEPEELPVPMTITKSAKMGMGG